MPRDDGFSLMEVLITVAVLGIAVTMLITGLVTAAAGSGSSRELADARALLAGTAERLEVAAYQPCATTTSYSAAVAAVVLPGSADGTGAAAPPSIDRVDVWTGSAFVPSGVGSNCDYDQRTGAAGASRMQRLVLSHGSDKLTMIKRGPS